MHFCLKCIKFYIFLKIQEGRGPPAPFAMPMLFSSAVLLVEITRARTCTCRTVVLTCGRDGNAYANTQARQQHTFLATQPRLYALAKYFSPHLQILVNIWCKIFDLGLLMSNCIEYKYKYFVNVFEYEYEYFVNVFEYEYEYFTFLQNVFEYEYEYSSTCIHLYSNTNTVFEYPKPGSIVFLSTIP